MAEPTEAQKQKARELMRTWYSTISILRLSYMEPILAQMEKDIATFLAEAATPSVEWQPVLSKCREALMSLPEDALGRDAQGGWYYRDELVANIDKVLPPPPKERE